MLLVKATACGCMGPGDRPGEPHRRGHGRPPQAQRPSPSQTLGTAGACRSTPACADCQHCSPRSPTMSVAEQLVSSVTGIWGPGARPCTLHAHCRATHVGVQGCSSLQCSCPEDVSCGSAQRIRACRNDGPDLNSSWDVSGHEGRLHHGLGSLARVLHPRSRLQSRDQPHNLARRWLLLGTTEPCAASRPDMASCCCSVQQQTAARCAPCFG